MRQDSSQVTSISSEDFKTEPEAPAASGGILWRMGSGMVNMTKGAVGGTVGLGVGAVKLVASTSYVVASKTAEVGVNATKAVAGKSYDVVAGGVSTVTSRLPSVPRPSLASKKDKTE
ncbi:uncharacterized protein LOC100178921 isoform X3 [Ciona intestinalis]|uniref:uncharacterized protein LOC100178921 isoform X3 n=1 Tax=Ciona intestinalis TaxID=7719 RepID=UPI000224BBBC|nr:uncharacterized protein LOC100178921 isoform X3 [Ciona intestinalis]|eukprot:XP_009858106.1 uncharacterized protein LOC100178921 isoform X3 [Ciona intestinalis]